MSTTSLKTMVLLMALFISSSQSAPINEEQTNEGIVVIPSLTIDATSSSVYSYEEYSTVLLEVSPSPTPSPSQLPTATPTMSTNLQLLAIPQFNYLTGAVNKAEEEGGQVAPVDIFTGGTPKTGLVFVLETYSTGTTNGEDNYYKLRVKDTQQYVYFTADRHLKIGPSQQDNHKSASFKRTVYHDPKLPLVAITLKAIDSDCYIGFNSNGGYCASEGSKQYMIETPIDRRIG